MELEIRPQVRAFSAHMERTLRRNDHKGGWSLLDRCWLLMRLQEEVEEVRALLCNFPDRYDREAILREATDIANFAMMIADNTVSLLDEPAEGEG